MLNIVFLAEELDLSSALFVGLLHDQGHKVELLTFKSSGLLDTILEKGINVQIPAGVPKVKAIRDAVQEADILHVLHGEFTTYCAVKALRGNSRTRLIVNSDITGGLGRWTRIARFGVRHPRVQHVICHSHATRRYLRKIGVKHDRSTTIYPACALDAYDAVRATNLSEFGVGERDLVVLCAGDIVPNSGVIPLLQTLVYLGTQPKIHFLLAGNIIDERVYDQRDRNHTPHDIHLLGPRDDIPELLAASDLLCLPARKLPRIPSALYHAMAMGKPCVVSSAGGMRELIEHRSSGHVVHGQDPRELAKAINHYLRDPQIARITGDNARKTATNLFHPEQVASAAMRVYGSSLDKGQKVEATGEFSTASV